MEKFAVLNCLSRFGIKSDLAGKKIFISNKVTWVSKCLEFYTIKIMLKL